MKVWSKGYRANVCLHTSAHRAAVRRITNTVEITQTNTSRVRTGVWPSNTTLQAYGVVPNTQSMLPPSIDRPPRVLTRLTCQDAQANSQQGDQLATWHNSQPKKALGPLFVGPCRQHGGAAHPPPITQPLLRRAWCPRHHAQNGCVKGKPGTSGRPSARPTWARAGSRSTLCCCCLHIKKPSRSRLYPVPPSVSTSISVLILSINTVNFRGQR